MNLYNLFIINYFLLTFNISYAFLSINKNIDKNLINNKLFSKKNIFDETNNKYSYKPRLEYFLYDSTKSTYIIIANINRESYDLLSNIKKNKINYIFADKENFTTDELIETASYFKITDNQFILTKPLIFLGINKYIGSTYEMYDIISKC